MSYMKSTDEMRERRKGERRKRKRGKKTKKSNIGRKIEDGKYIYRKLEETP